MKKFDFFEMKMIIGCKKKPNGEAYIIPWWIEGNLPLITSRILYRTKDMKITCWLKQVKKFDVLEMKMIFDCKKKDEKMDFSFIGVNYPQIIEG